MERTTKIKEKRTIITTAILNLIVAIIKFISGVSFSFSTLVADSIQSFIDFFTDITSLIANKIGKRRANKTYPFGYGQVYYLSNLFTGIMLFLIGVFIVYQIFATDNIFEPNIFILFILIVVLVLKYIVISLLQSCGKSTRNELLLESYKESRTDFVSTCVVIVVLIVSYLEKYISIPISFDKIGSVCMAIYIFYTSIKMIISNIRGILVNDEENDELKEKIKIELEKYNEFKVTDIKIIKMSFYYRVLLQIDVNDNLKIKDFLKIEKKIKRHLRKSIKLIKFIDIEPL